MSQLLFNSTFSCSTAESEPIIADPEVRGGISLDDSCSFLILMTDGLYKSLEDATGTEHANVDIASMVAKEFQEQSTLHGVAQAVVDRIVRIHHDTYMTCTDLNKKQMLQVRDDITLLVRNFNYPLPNAMSSPTPMGLTSSIFSKHQTPLSVIIPSGGDRSPPARPVFSLATNKNTTGTISLTRSSTNDSTQSGEESSQAFSQSTRSLKSLDVDENGRIEAYVDFAAFYQALKELTESQLEEFNTEAEPKPAYETIHEEAEDPTVKSRLGSDSRDA